METNSIFFTQDELNKNKGGNISGKISYTNIMDTIPKESLEKPLKNWEQQKKTEWRWRFLKFPDDRVTVEISFKKPDEERIYFNKKGEWVERFVDPVFDDYVEKSFYYYADQK